jgi:hypothetical protein
VSPSISGFGRFCCKKILRGALANPLVTYLADAKKAGAEVRPMSNVRPR